ncbi:Gfo/Idh/MocA family protein [Lederbergia citrea]|uniref:Gfo/Idh/MocA family protein n=1 Tax=Lederbergia citrea TaxID=2833581 RepID=UPI001BC9D1E4|nr:Gfo/Idh/MocA family oxidoreductase [Lederbergia citrea]MBS4179008.1 Gfo/Idh/MocA family oxidoreductase [Lederbergia citrea]
MKVGIVGGCKVGKYRAELYSQINHVELVGIVDIQEEEGSMEAYSTLEQLVEAENPDIIDICLPTYLQREYVVKAAAFGKHVICQSPMSHSETDANDMIHACQEAGVHLMISNPLIISPEYSKVKNMIEQNAIGNVGTVRIIKDRNFPKETEKSGEIILQLVNDIQWLQSLFGNIERVYAKGLNEEALPIDVTYMSLRFENGVIAHVNGNWLAASGDDRLFLEVAGEKGVISYHSEEAIPIFASYYENQPVKEKKYTYSSNPSLEELKYFVNCIESDVPKQDAFASFNALKCGLAAIKSIKDNKVITFLDRRTTV